MHIPKILNASVFKNLVTKITWNRQPWFYYMGKTGDCQYNVQNL